jgi:Tol biopolymer transport system component
MKRCLRTVSFLLILAPRLAAADDVIVSRRVYATAGRSYRQLWVWSPDTGAFEPLTRASRHHDNPRCSADGRQIEFSSDDLRLRFDRTTGVEAAIDDASAPSLPLPQADVSSAIGGCDAGTASRSHDGNRVVCAVRGQDIAVVDVARQREVVHVTFDEKSADGYGYTPWPLQSTWSPDDARLLVGTYGYGSSSTSSFLDYFVLDVATRRWTRGFSGNDAAWLSDGRRIVFTRPRDLTWLPGTAKRVWTTQLAVFDLVSGTATTVASDVANHEGLTLCRSR